MSRMSLDSWESSKKKIQIIDANFGIFFIQIFSKLIKINFILFYYKKMGESHLCQFMIIFMLELSKLIYLFKIMNNAILI